MKKSKIILKIKMAVIAFLIQLYRYFPNRYLFDWLLNEWIISNHLFKKKNQNHERQTNHIQRY